MDEKKWQPLIHAYALDNALSHDGKAQAGAVLSHLFNEGLNKDEIKEIMPLIQSEIKKINSLNQEKQKKEFESYEKLVKKHEEKENYEFAAVLNDVIKNYDRIKELSDTSKKQPKQSKKVDN